MDRHIAMRLQERDLTVKKLHPVLHGRRQGGRREVTLGAIAQHLGQAVVTRHDNKSTAGTSVKHEEMPLWGGVSQARHGLITARR